MGHMGCIYGHSSSEKIDARLAAEEPRPSTKGWLTG